MPINTPHKSYKLGSGFTLVEMAIVLVIVGTLLGMSLSVGQAQLKVADIKGTNQNIEVVSKALQLYQQKRKRYPCPATYTEVAGNAGYGYETNPATNCTGALQGSNAYMGFVPFKTLGISEQLAYDAWGNRLTYVIDKAHVTSSEFESGSLSIFDASGNEVTTSSALGKAIFAVVSHGEDEKGAYSASGALVKACGTTASDVANCTPPPNTATAVRVVASFVVDGISDSSAGYYNDWVSWKGQEQIEPVQVAIGGEENPYFNPIIVFSQATCIIADTNRVMCTGRDNDGVLGNAGGSNTTSFNAEANGFADWESIHNGGHGGLGYSACGLKNGGSIFCWGDNASGELGNGAAPTDSQLPLAISGTNTGWTSVSVSTDHGCGIRNGIAYCWGTDIDGAMGNGGTNCNSSTPFPVDSGYEDGVLVASSITDWVQVSTSTTHSCGIRRNGEAYCWGNGGHGRLGTNDLTNRQSPERVAGGFTDWEYIHAASVHSCGIRAGGLLYCWGRNNTGQLGVGAIGSSSVPVQVMPTVTNWSHISTGYGESSTNTTCATRSSGEAYCWGSNANGKVGLGVAGGSYNTPQQLAGNDWKFAVVSVDNFGCGAKRNGDLYCWGMNINGEFGNSTTDATTVYAPTLIAGVKVKVE